MQGHLAEVFEKGRLALAEGEATVAADLLEYAHRRAPEDGRIALTLACARMQLRDAGALDLLRQVAGRHGVREAWHSLAVFGLNMGRAEQAAPDLAQFLARHAPLAEAQASYDDITRQAGAAGWSGVSVDGMLTVSLPRYRHGAAALAADLAIDLDGRPLEAQPATGAAGRASCWLPAGWQRGHRLNVRLDGRHLLGSPHDCAAIGRTEGVVWRTEGGLEGWAWMPADPDRDPLVTLRGTASPGAAIELVLTEAWTELATHAPLARPRRLRVAAAALAGLRGAIAVLGADGRPLYGAPLLPDAIATGPELPPLRQAAPAVAVKLDWRPPVAIVIPVYGARAFTLSCLRQVRATAGEGVPIVVVDDASPDPALAAALDAQAASGDILLERLAQNGGFPAAANAGMRLAADADIVLLNTDTVLPEGWLARLQQAAYAAAEVGTVTPLSNEATILSYPSRDGANPVPDAAGVARLDAIARAANAGLLVDIPTAVGFCMYIRRDCLDAVGPFRDDVFAQGYGEENDFCQRARRLGWRNVALPGLYVGHVGGRSFGGARRHLAERNQHLLNRLHPGYDALVAGFQRADPLAPARRRMDALRWQDGRSQQGAVILVGHASGGGVRRRLLERCAEIRAAGQRPILLLPETPPGPLRRAAVSEDDPGAWPNLAFALPDEQDALVALLRDDRPTQLELHQWIGHDPAIFGLAAALGVPYDVVVHDYAWFCPRVTLTGADGRYCGEPPPARCETCVRQGGGRLEEDIAPVDLRRRSAVVLAGARRVSAPSRDVARRMARQFDGLACLVAPPESEAPPPRLPPPPRPPGDTLRVLLVGGISPQKGFDYLLACARDAVARGLPIRFRLVGHSSDDAALLATGAVAITGPYEEAEAPALIRRQQAHLGFLPSVCPETWSYTLSHMWREGLQVALFDLGAPAERAGRTGNGLVLPLGLPAPRFNDLVLRRY